MTTTNILRDRIITLLSRGLHITNGQLLELLNANDDVRALELTPAVTNQLLRTMVAKRLIERTTGGDVARYRMAPLRCRYEARETTAHEWFVVRNETVIGQHMTEVEASACVAALNELGKHK